MSYIKDKHILFVFSAIFKGKIPNEKGTYD